MWHAVTITTMTAKKKLPAPARQKRTKPNAGTPEILAPPEPTKPKRSTKAQPALKKPAAAWETTAPAAPEAKRKGTSTPKVKVSARAARHTPAKASGKGKGRGAGGGQPTLYKEEYAAFAHNMCAILGATNKELAEVLGVSERTIANWIAAHPEFKTALSSGKLIADANVAAALYKTAVGYSHEDIDIRTVALGMNQGSEIVITPITKIVQPNPISIQWWLKNRRPADWKDKSEVSVEHNVPNEEECRARFTDRMAAAAKLQAAVRASRRERGMTGD